MNTIEKRSEIIFLYDAKLCNPNGDPMDSNRPRIDEETGKCLVTDVRLKRTIRDFFISIGYDGTEEGKDVFLRDINGEPPTGLERAKDYKNKADFLSKFIDARLFGAVSAPSSKDKKEKENKTFHLTGPVQFGMGKSLNVVKENFIKGTGAFTNSEASIQRTFREEYNITYGLIGFHGVINENAAKDSYCTEADIELLLQGMWDGTKNLLTRSKKGHMPRLIVKIDYKEKGFFVGDLLERLSLKPEATKKLNEYEDITDFVIETEQLNKVLEAHKEKIAKVTVKIDERVKLSSPIFNNV